MAWTPGQGAQASKKPDESALGLLNRHGVLAANSASLQDIPRRDAAPIVNRGRPLMVRREVPSESIREEGDVGVPVLWPSDHMSLAAPRVSPSDIQREYRTRLA